MTFVVGLFKCKINSWLFEFEKSYFNSVSISNDHFLYFFIVFFPQLLLNTMSSIKESKTKPKKAAYFTSNSAGYNFLAHAFKQYNQTDGVEGINPFLTDRKDINDIFDRYSVFQAYSKDSFPHRFLSLAEKFRISKFKERKRQSPC